MLKLLCVSATLVKIFLVFVKYKLKNAKSLVQVNVATCVYLPFFFLKNSCVLYAVHVETPVTRRFDVFAFVSTRFAFIVSRDAIFFAGMSEGAEMIKARSLSNF